MQTDTKLLGVNILFKMVLTVIASHFYFIGDMFLAGLFLGWVVLEIVGIIGTLAIILTPTLWR